MKIKLAVLLTMAVVVVSALVTHGAAAAVSRSSVVILFVPNASLNEMRSLVAASGGAITREYTIINGVAAIVPTQSIQGLKMNPLVLSVDQDVQVRASDSAADHQISADQVWPLGYTGNGIRLAILDTGIATAHSEFSGRIVACHTEVSGTTTCEDDNGHGTHVAGIAGAQGVNASAKGVAPAVSFMSDKVLDSSGSGSLSQVIAGINWAVSNNAKIISMSLGTSPVDGGGTQSNCDGAFPTLTTAVSNAVGAGVTVVAAAGNSGASGLGAPGCISSAIAVGAVDNTNTVASFSSRGAALADHGVAAPGVNIFSTWLNGGYNTLSGTSMATPMVSGTIALVLSKNSNLSPTVIRNIIRSTSDCVENPCPNNDIGYGRINALTAVNSLISTTIHINSYPTTDTYFRSHGLAIDTPLPNPWWPPYHTGYEFLQSGTAFDYTTTVYLPPGSHYVQEAASGFVPNYAWHTKIYINSVLTAEGDVGRANPLQANFVISTTIHIHSYPTTDTYYRSHGLAIDTPLPNPWWPPYHTGYEFLQSGTAFDYTTTASLSAGSHYAQEAASGFVPSNAWHTLIYINGALRASGDVGRANPLQANFIL